MTPHFHLRSPIARRPATSSDASALPGQDVSGDLRSRLAEKDGQSTLLVILHYLLKNNINIYGDGIAGEIGGGLQPPVILSPNDPPHRLEDW